MRLNKLRWLVSAFVYEVVITAHPESESINIEPQSGIVITSEINEFNAQQNIDRSIEIEHVDDNELEPSVRVAGQINRTIKTGIIYSTKPSFGIYTKQEIGKIGNK